MPKNLSKNYRRGFTLLETLIYATLVGSFVTVFTLITYQIIDFSGRLENQRELSENQRFAVQKFHWLVVGATINSPAQGSSAVSLTVTKSGIGQLIMDQAGGALRLKTGAGDPIPLTNNYVTVNNLLFEHLNFSGKSAIRITAELENDIATTSIDTTIIVQ